MYLVKKTNKQKIHIYKQTDTVQTRAVKGFTVLYEKDTQAEMLQSVEQTKLKFQESTEPEI